MPIESAIARLKSQAALLYQVDGAADFASIETAPRQLPAAFVTPWTQRPQPSLLDTMQVEQRVAVQIAVNICVSNLREPGGRSALDALKPVLAQVQDVLGGWSPMEGYDPFMLGDGRLLKLLPGALWWTQIFNTAYIWRSK
ncbi:MAG: hypothetical protein PHH47_09995 [Gallionella sp.]|nr:hypothetical protein [Gallionella sp.]MDD4947203.1 hypothetical protein [Gallionella sp.]